VQLKDGVRILKLVAREAPGQRGIGDPQVQQTIRDTLKNRKEQLLKAAYLATVRDEAKVTNYLRRQVIEAAGRLPEAAKTSFPSKQGTPPKLVFLFFYFFRETFFQSTQAKTSPAFTAWPSFTKSFSTRPLFGERISFCIFIASTTSKTLSNFHRIFRLHRSRTIFPDSAQRLLASFGFQASS